MDKKTRTAVIVVMLVVAIALYFIAGTYARYTTDKSGNATLQVAKWAVAIKKGAEGPTLNDLGELEFTVDSTDVASGKIAPSVTATAEVGIDLTGTEVSVDITAKLDEEQVAAQLSTALGESVSDIKVTATPTGFGDAATGLGTSGEATINLPNQAAFTAENGVGTIKIAITWTNNEDHNASDTTAGESATSISVPITLEVKQHIA